MQTTWLHHHDTNTLLTAGNSNDVAAALPLQPAIVRHPAPTTTKPHPKSRSVPDDKSTSNSTATTFAVPAAEKRFCYLSQLVINEVEGYSTKYWYLVVTNAVATTKTYLKPKLVVEKDQWRKAGLRPGISLVPYISAGLILIFRWR